MDVIPNYEDVPKRKRGRPPKTRINPDELREEIQARWIIHQLHEHIAGKIALTMSQVKAADVLLRKIVPDVQMQHITGEMQHKFVVELPAQMTRAEWLKRYSPKQIEGHVNGNAPKT